MEKRKTENLLQGYGIFLQLHCVCSIGSSYPNKDELALRPMDSFKGHLKLHQESNSEAGEMDAGLGVPAASLEVQKTVPRIHIRRSLLPVTPASGL